MNQIFSLFSNHIFSICYRSRRLQPFHLPLAAGVHRRGPCVNLSTLRSRDIREGVHRQTDEPVQVLRVRILRERLVGSGRNSRYERLPNRLEETKSSAETVQRGL